MASACAGSGCKLELARVVVKLRLIYAAERRIAHGDVTAR
jgi:hypothetical protein